MSHELLISSCVYGYLSAHIQAYKVEFSGYDGEGLESLIPDRMTSISGFLRASYNYPLPH
jgi:hypothetical protein